MPLSGIQSFQNKTPLDARFHERDIKNLKSVVKGWFMNVVLTGFMGTGKSAVSRLLSKKLDWELIDADVEIEKAAGMKISDIFATKGEPYFRSLETEVINKLSQKNEVVISCGGGVVLKPENMDALEKNGFVVCLTATPETIYERTKHTKDRPLLNVPDPIAKIKDLLEKRATFYKRCHLTIDTTHLSIEEVVEEILNNERFKSK
jgi:shikimate kinase